MLLLANHGLIQGGGSGVNDMTVIYDNITSTTMSLYWNKVVGATNYVVTQNDVEIYSGPATTLAVTDLSETETYNFKVSTPGHFGTLAVTIPPFYGCASFGSTNAKAELGTRQTALEPSDSGVDRAMSWTIWARLSNNSVPNRANMLFNVRDTANTNLQYAMNVIGSDNNTPGTSETLRFILFTNTTNFIYIQSDVRIKKGKSCFIGITYDGSETAAGLEMYLDGQKITSPIRVTNGTYTGAMNNSNLRFAFGNTSLTTRHLNGNLLHGCIWNKELSESEMTEAWNGGVPKDMSTLSFYSDITAYWPMQTDFDCANNATFNLTGSGTVSFTTRAINPNTNHLSFKRGEIGNTRYVAFGGVVRPDASNLFVHIRSGTSHLANGKITKIPIVISTAAAAAPIDVITDGTYDLRGGSSGIIGSNIFVGSSRYNTGGDTFQDARLYKSTDGLVGEAFDSGTSMTVSYSRYNFYGKMIGVGDVVGIPFFGHDGAGTWKVSLFITDDGADSFTKEDVFDGMSHYGEAGLIYHDGIWMMLMRRNDSPFGVYLTYSDDDRATWSTPVLTNLAGTGGASNVDIVVNSVGRLHVVIMDRSDDFLRLSKNNDIQDVIADPTAFNASSPIFRSYETDSLNILGYPNMLHLGNENYFIGSAAEFSASRSDYYFGIGKINEPV